MFQSAVFVQVSGGKPEAFNILAPPSAAAAPQAAVSPAKAVTQPSSISVSWFPDQTCVFNVIDTQVVAASGLETVHDRVCADLSALDSGIRIEHIGGCSNDAGGEDYGHDSGEMHTDLDIGMKFLFFKKKGDLCWKI